MAPAKPCHASAALPSLSTCNSCLKVLASPGLRPGPCHGPPGRRRSCSSFGWNPQSTKAESISQKLRRCFCAWVFASMLPRGTGALCGTRSVETPSFKTCRSTGPPSEHGAVARLLPSNGLTRPAANRYLWHPIKRTPGRKCGRAGLEITLACSANRCCSTNVF